MQQTRALSQTKGYCVATGLLLHTIGILHQKFGLCTRFRADPPNVAPGRGPTISVSCVIPDLRVPAKCLTPIVTDKESRGELPSSRAQLPGAVQTWGRGPLPSPATSPPFNPSQAPFGLLDSFTSSYFKPYSHYKSSSQNPWQTAKCVFIRHIRFPIV